MKKIILTVGCPGSGKSTWAAEQKDCHIVCRDDIRKMLKPTAYKHTKENEELVTTIQRTTISNLINDTSVKTIIIADTNLTPHTKNFIQRIVEKFSYDVTIEEKVFDVPWTTLVERNKGRGEKAVPMHVLRSMYLLFLKRQGFKKYIPDAGLPEAVIFDIDGTLAMHKGRGAYEYWKCDSDGLNLGTYHTYKAFKDAGYKILILSGREEGTKSNPTKYREMTEQWLARNGIEYDVLMMRSAGDHRPDYEVKEGFLFSDALKGYNVTKAVDDRDQVVELWRRHGIFTMQVAFGDF